MPDPLVSIIVPYRNAEPTLRFTLDSCLKQTHGNLELILVDNASTDAGPALARSVCEQAPVPCLLLDCPEQGANRARNLGFAHASGEYVQWLDADDFLTPDKVRLQVAALEEQRNRDIAYGDWYWNFLLSPRNARQRFESLRRNLTPVPPEGPQWQFQDGETPFARLPRPQRQHDDMLLRLLEDKWLPPHGYLLRRSAADRLDALRAFDPLTEIHQDRQYFTTAALIGLRFLYVPATAVYYNSWSETQKTRSVSAARRAANLGRIFRRLRELADTTPGLDLSDAHRTLLDQSWDLWRFPGGEILIESRDADGVQVRHMPSGRRFRMNEGLTRIARLLAAFSEPMTRERFALRITDQIAELRDRHLEVLGILATLAENGLLVRVESPPDTLDASEHAHR